MADFFADNQRQACTDRNQLDRGVSQITRGFDSILHGNTQAGAQEMWQGARDLAFGQAGLAARALVDDITTPSDLIAARHLPECKITGDTDPSPRR